MVGCSFLLLLGKEKTKRNSPQGLCALYTGLHIIIVLGIPAEDQWSKQESCQLRLSGEGSELGICRREKSVSDIKQDSTEVSSRISSDSLVACLQSKADAEKVCQNSQGTGSVDMKGP